MNKLNRSQLSFSDSPFTSLSIIIPWRNTSPQLLFRAIDSVLRQSYLGPLQIVVCNDHSNPDLARIVKSHISSIQNNPSNIDVIYIDLQSGSGISAARNRAAMVADGEYYCWLDADDELVESAIELLIINYKGLPMVVGRCLVLEIDGKATPRESRPYFVLSMSHKGTVHDPLGQAIFSCQPQIVSAKLFHHVQGFDDSFLFAEMTDFFLRMVCEVGIESVGYSKDAWYVYNRNKGSHSTNRKALNHNRERALMRYMTATGIKVDAFHYIPCSTQDHSSTYCPKAPPPPSRV